MEKLKTWLKAERGRVSSLARECKVTHGAVLQWVEVPAHHVRVVASITGIPANELRPDVFDAPIPASHTEAMAS